LEVAGSNAALDDRGAQVKVVDLRRDDVQLTANMPRSTSGPGDMLAE
jgi:hypothetical protein